MALSEVLEGRRGGRGRLAAANQPSAPSPTPAEPPCGPSCFLSLPIIRSPQAAKGIFQKHKRDHAMSPLAILQKLPIKLQKCPNPCTGRQHSAKAASVCSSISYLLPPVGALALVFWTYQLFASLFPVFQSSSASPKGSATCEHHGEAPHPSHCPRSCSYGCHLLKPTGGSYVT